ncbi:MAG: hypothetical protein HZA93_12360 [Verrucomicrobia bacterium]|nr:hypothetical protein [Verrucomicrobiota bacterium]
MRETYWLLLLAFVITGAAAWLGLIVGKRRSKKLLLDAQLRGEALIPSNSIWTRDLLDNRFGHILRCYVIPLFLVAIGLIQIATQDAAVRGFDYRGFDAVCIGIGSIGLGVASFAGYRLPESNQRERQIKNIAVFSGAISFVVSFSIALFRNI